MQDKLKHKLINLTRELEYYKKVYPRSNKKVNKLRCKIYYYNKKLTSLYG